MRIPPRPWSVGEAVAILLIIALVLVLAALAVDILALKALGVLR